MFDKSTVTTSPVYLKEKIEKAYKLLEDCNLCPRRCSVNRIKGEKGFCRTGGKVVVSSYGHHFGEELPLVGIYGSGTIFFEGCNLRCIFCQNYDISHPCETDGGPEIEVSVLVQIMLQLQSRGCHNINFVTPTHVTPQVMEAIYLARRDGLTIPIVYNCGGYESKETLELLDGFIEIYMPDAKYSNKEWAKKLSFAEDYPEVMKTAIKEMHRQVGDLQIENDLATTGLLVRHLVMPGDVAGSKGIIDFIATEISQNTYINVMEQYRPVFKAFKYKEIDRRITNEEFLEVYAYAKEKGLRLAE